MWQRVLLPGDLPKYFPLMSVLLSLWLSACASPSSDINALSEDNLYEHAQEHLDKKYWRLAIESLRRLESNHPFGKYAQAAQLSLIYAYYQSDELELAAAAAKRFIRLHPNHPQVDYAYYLRGLAAFPRADTFFQSAFNTDLSRKSTKNAEQAILHFSALIKNFPDSDYSADAVQRMRYLRNLIARHDINIANYYLDYKAYTAAANRARHVLENFQQSPAVADALAILVYSYRQLRIPALATDSLNILRVNYPDYPALTAAGDFDETYIHRQKFSLLKWLSVGLIDNSGPPGFDTRHHYNAQ
ncbi:MAG: outer membrane protein assembly factor BamD [Cellvibrionaceae bacterium]|nr:outer membrane protein assembly factor BamD [Cellvibrionaceae bacterium]